MRVNAKPRKLDYGGNPEGRGSENSPGEGVKTAQPDKIGRLQQISFARHGEVREWLKRSASKADIP